MSSQKPSWIGQTLAGRYKIETLLGQGGMSAVYKGTDPNLRRSVAVKLIHPHLASDQDFVRRFEEEAAAVASLRHPNIIQVFDFSHDGDTYYMVLEYLPGESLDQRLVKLNNRAELMPVTQAAEFMHSLCNAVGYAHDQGMVHRDLKPANVMISPKEEVVLMDFGIAKIMGGESHTATGALVGTIVYMSPEQIRGEPAGPSADIYALGIILYEMVTGRRPFQGENTAATMMAHLSDPIPDARKYNPNTPPEIITVIERALDKNPKTRYQSAHDMAADLREFLGLGSQVHSGIRSQLAAPHPATEVVQPSELFDSGMTQVDSRVRQPASGVNVPAGAKQLDSAVDQTDSQIRNSGGRGTRFLSGLGLVFLIIIIGACAGLFFLSSQLSFFGDEPTETPPAVAEATAEPTEEPEPTATDEPEPTATDEPEIAEEPTEPSDSDTPVPDDSDTAITTPVVIATDTPDVPTPPPFTGIQITNVIERNNELVVEYEIIGFQQSPLGSHLHFYFNNIDELDAGVPGDGPYLEHDGPPPFITNIPANIPLGVTQICGVIAGRLHQVRPGTSSCFDLP